MIQGMQKMLFFFALVAINVQADSWQYQQYDRRGMQWGGGQQQQQPNGQGFSYYNYQPNRGFSIGSGSVDRNGNFNSIQIGPDGPQWSFGNIQRQPSTRGYGYED